MMKFQKNKIRSGFLPYSRLPTHHLLLLLGLSSFVIPASADDREVTAEQQAAIAGTNEEIPTAKPKRPARLPDLTKGDLIPQKKIGPNPWSFGPTGILGIMAGGFGSDQIQIQGARKGSPAEGKFLFGDVITGINGRPFVAGEHLGYRIGKDIIEAEKEENGGHLTFQVWRDKNFVKRNSSKDLQAVDVEEIFTKTKNDDSLFEWKSEKEKEKEIRNQGFDEFPIDPMTLEVAIQIRVMPPYSDTSPYNCPKTDLILEEAWKVLKAKFVKDPKKPRSGRGGTIEAMALVASGKPEHREIVRKWVRSPHCPWKPPTEPIGARFEPGYRGYNAMQTWHHGFNGLYCALYYEATGDDYVLPALRKYAIEAAMGQSGGGSWGHTFAFPSFNGGEFNKMNPGYGALNAAGNRCFYLVTLAQKLGVKHPAIDKAVERAQGFFSSYIDQGCIPYGDHAAYPSDDSNGKNTGVAFSLKLLGDNYGAKYFSMMSSHCSFTRRGGHGHDYHGNWSFWGATLCGPEVRILGERNMRWRRTLCRQFDGSFVYHSPTYGGLGGPLRDPTATAVMTYSVPLKQTLITGKNPDESLYPDKREMNQLLASAYPQFNDDKLKQLAGSHWQDRDTDELFEILDMFKPKTRAQIARELGKRYQAGETAISTRLVPLLAHNNARYRDGAVQGLAACGKDAALPQLSRISDLLEDPHDFVRISAARAMASITTSKESQEEMLQATVDSFKAVAPNSVTNTTQKLLFDNETLLAANPFGASIDNDLVKQALEKAILLDPVHGSFMKSRAKVWSKDTVVKLAGPLTFAAEEEQIADQMFASRSPLAQAILNQHGFMEGVLSSAHRVRKQAAIPRDIRAIVGFKRPLAKPDQVKKYKGLYRELIPAFQSVLIGNPLAQISEKKGNKVIITPLDEMLRIIESDKKPSRLPSIEKEVALQFSQEIAKAGSTREKIQLCRKELENPERKTYFRKMTAMTHLTELLGQDVLQDLLPYLNHEYFRLCEHAQKRAAPQLATLDNAALTKLVAGAGSTEKQAGILLSLANHQIKSGTTLSKQALASSDPNLRNAALRAYANLGGSLAINDILAHLAKSSHKEDLRGCEEAVVTLLKNPVSSTKTKEALVALVPQVQELPAVRKRLYYLLGQAGDRQSLQTLANVARTEDMQHFDDVVHGLSFSNSRDADQMLLRFAAESPKSAKVVGKYAVHRMVLGPKGFGDLNDKIRMDFAEPMLKLEMNKKLISYLGKIHEARALRALMYCLEKGVAHAASALVQSGEGLKDLSPKDADIAAKAIRDVMEYMEVTHLRGGPTAHMRKEDKYVEWQALQARAGKALLKVKQPGRAPIPGFNDLDLDF
ncbi:MAG: hypothetical protein HOI65_08865 [Opitutae bacterium]|nr:hypothetical protein [Opitutae bacterium]MBT5691208.1 hypothetical protein [Opitutae bacterium]